MRKRFLIFGFGSVARSFFPLLIDYFSPPEVILVDHRSITIPQVNNPLIHVSFKKIHFTKENLTESVLSIVQDEDVIIDCMGCVESITVIKTCQSRKNTIYINTCLEEFEDSFEETQFALYAQLRKLKVNDDSTACIDCGANPGLITHFSILALRNMAKTAIANQVEDKEILQELLDKNDLKLLSKQLEVDVLHISELESFEVNKNFDGKIVTSWCAESFLWEWNLEGEIAVPSTFSLFEGCKPIENQDPPSIQIPFPMHMKSAIPNREYIGRIVRHPETIEISEVFYDPVSGHLPIVAFVYHPSNFILENFKKFKKKLKKKNNNLNQQNIRNNDEKSEAICLTKIYERFEKVILTEETNPLMKGEEAMGALLVSSRKEIKPRWFGSILSCEESRRLGCTFNPTIFQVATSILAHLKVVIDTNLKGLLMPHHFNSEQVMKIAAPLLGIVFDDDLPYDISTKWSDLITTQVL